MDSHLLGLIELLLVVGLVFGFGIAQLRSLKRDRDGTKDRKDDGPMDN